MPGWGAASPCCVVWDPHAGSGGAAGGALPPVPVLQHARWEHTTPAARVPCKSCVAREARCFPRRRAAQAALPASAARGAGEIVSYKPEHSLALSEVKSRLLDPCFAKRQGRTTHKHYMESQ